MLFPFRPDLDWLCEADILVLVCLLQSQTLPLHLLILLSPRAHFTENLLVYNS